jgi:hypothetical protein
LAIEMNLELTTHLQVFINGRLYHNFEHPVDKTKIQWVAQSKTVHPLQKITTSKSFTGVLITHFSLGTAIGS